MVNVDVLSAALNHYRLEKVLTINNSSYGFVNRSYRVETTSGTYLLRYYTYSKQEDILSEVVLLNDLAERNFPVAPPIPRRDGTYLNRDQEGYSVLFQFMEGSLPSLNQETVGTVARAVARLNVLPPPAGIEKQFYCTPDYCRKLMDSFPQAKFQYPDLFAFYREEFSFLEPFLERAVPQGLIHGDVFPDNTLFQGNRLRAIVDFDEFGIGPLLTEIGTAVNGFCFVEEEFQETLYRVFLEQYETIRPLEPLERELLPIYLRWGAFVFVSWHLRELLQRRNKRQLERVHLFINRIHYFRRRFFEEVRDQTVLNESWR
jgi:homoserine kinase type II